MATDPARLLVGPRELAGLLAGIAPPAVLDVRWPLGAGTARERYLAGHVPGAVHVTLDEDLAAPRRDGRLGRHPLPATEDFEAAMRRAGVSAGRQVVVYDDGGVPTAARAWWLLRWAGHEAVRVLDGGLAAWVAAGGPLEAGEGAPPPAGDFVARPGARVVLEADEAAALARSGVLLDARAPARYRGEEEPFDPVGGHIPGARSLPTAQNLTEEGRFLEPPALRARFEEAGVGGDGEVGVYCGSGVTAAHELLALELAGFRPGGLFVGSWSAWSADPTRPVATGPEPG